MQRSEAAPLGREGIAVAMRRARQTAALSQAEFARRLGELRREKPHQAATVGAWERAEAMPDALDLANAARVADVPLSWLFGSDEFNERLTRLERILLNQSRTLEQRALLISRLERRLDELEGRRTR